ncbi:hypothetical protein [Rubellimicrobium sp. CFH 75288]|uniref:hypothetical protein n=1 Tax=Rubellimicrobium sp. CFH 75288 TaxID=2697034 RepID=UPI0014121080|nr:hypothetical protein [Rubellimicrobium sp. CFH 75288]NAZ35528.1 hypothetical protein [Rubellimicrobium sp. CFH 75288]
MKAQPTLATPQDHRRHFEDSLVLLRAVRTTLADLLARAESGEDMPFREIAAKQAELETALRRAFEAEARWNGFAAESAAASPDGPLDLEALRADLACRLSRIAACCAEGA